MRFSAFQSYADSIGVAVDVVAEAQDSDYETGIAQLPDGSWHIRTARNTPTKPGAFVAFWRRDSAGRTAPFPQDDAAAGLLVFVEQNDRRGVFRFTRSHLADLGITAGPGKRGFRVYPTWCVGLNATARATQHAQSPAFTEY
ncbi:MepB family protein [Microbacterium sp. ZW T5_56]|uniref:MepB family protein n=1 Tax=Microbacterium sp. ZW T5_56 TaxID=3378081 RepID=UPI00385468BF